MAKKQAGAKKPELADVAMKPHLYDLKSHGKQVKSLATGKKGQHHTHS